MVFSLLSIASLCGSYLRRCFTDVGLSRHALDIDDETTIHFWGPKRTTPTKQSLVLLHGFGPVSIWQWHRQVEFFAPDYNVYVPDLVFFGDSTTKSTERSEIFQANCVVKLLEKLGVEKYYVIGTSYGGMIAYNMARLWPERLAGKVVIASSGVNMRKSDNEEFLKRAKQESVGNVMVPQNASELRALLSVATNRRLPLVPDFFLNDFVKQLYGDKRDEKLELLKGLSIGKDETPNITPLQQDVLLVWGEDDQIFPLEMARKLERLVAHLADLSPIIFLFHALNLIIGEKVKLEIMPNASHVPQMEKPTRFNFIVKNFLSGSS